MAGDVHTSRTSQRTRSSRASRTWTIAELADEFGVTLRTIRFYEEHGLLTPERRGTQRVFHQRERVRLRLILRGKRLGFPLEEIKKIVGMYDAEPGEVGQLRYLLGQIEVRRTELEQRRKDIEETLAELDDLEHRCRVDLAQLVDDPSRPDTVARPASRVDRAEG